MRTLAIGLCILFATTACDLISKDKAADKAATEAKAATAAAAAGAEGWTELFDGKSMDGWKVNENPASWSVKDGLLVANGQRSHLFYVGAKEPFVDFELEAVVKTKPNSNSGIYIHTQYQDSGWPKYGFEVQVNNSFPDPQKTGGLYEVVKITDAPAKDDTWFTMLIRVEGKHITVKVDGKTVTDYTEPEGKKPGEDFTRVVDKGTFALQAHDPGSTVCYKSIKVRRLP
jgi:hypothetical protein